MTHTTSDAERAVRAHNEIWNERDYSRIPKVVSPSYVEYNPAAPEGEIRGPDGLEETIRGITTAFPDVQAELLDTFADEDTVLAELRFTMTHEGEFNGIPPTGRDVAFQTMAKFRVEDGTVEELQNYFDPRVLFDQLGVTEESPQELASSPDTSRSEENEQLARDHFDRVWNHGEFDTSVLTDDYRVHLDLGGHETYALDEFREFVTQVREAVPDLHKEPDDVFATDDKATIRYTMTGTQEGEVEGIPRIGDEIELNAIAIYRVEDRRLAESWIVADGVEPPTAEEHATKVGENGRDTFRRYAAHVSAAEAEQFGGLTAISLGLPAPVYNQIMVIETPEQADLETAITWTAERDVPFRVTVAEQHHSKVADWAGELGLVPTEETVPGMALDSLAEIPVVETAATFSKVTTQASLGEFTEVFASVFEMPPEFAEQANPASMLDDPDIRMFVGHVDGEAVACGQLVRTGDVAGVYSVGVKEGFRRGGIGEAMTWEVLRAGRAGGCDVATLQSSEMALPLYEQMGFETVVTYHLFEPAPSE